MGAQASASEPRRATDAGGGAGETQLGVSAVMILLALCGCWGLQQVSIKVAKRGMSPMVQASLRSGGSLVLLWGRELPSTPTSPSFVGLQMHTGRVAFRNIRIKPL